MTPIDATFLVQILHQLLKIVIKPNLRLIWLYESELVSRVDDFEVLKVRFRNFDRQSTRTVVLITTNEKALDRPSSEIILNRTSLLDGKPIDL